MRGGGFRHTAPHRGDVARGKTVEGPRVDFIGGEWPDDLRRLQLQRRGEVDDVPATKWKAALVDAAGMVAADVRLGKVGGCQPQAVQVVGDKRCQAAGVLAVMEKGKGSLRQPCVFRCPRVGRTADGWKPSGRGKRPRRGH